MFQPGDPMFLDTRGFILYLQGKYEASLVDMNAAVVGIEKLLDERTPTAARSKRRSQWFAITERSCWRSSAGMPRPKLDRARVKQLIGREPDETLF